MTPIHFQGLNCYHDCVITLANHARIDYPAAFSTLWSEISFRYDKERNAYLTKRLLTNFKLLGVKIEDSSCRQNPNELKTNLSLYNEDEFLIVGIDAFYLPWSQYYQTFHGSHYFIIQNINEGILPSHDPTFDKVNEQIPRDTIQTHAFDICRLKLIKKQSHNFSPANEAKQILKTHENTRKILLSSINNCKNNEPNNILLLSKQIDTMINNRYLFRFYLTHQPISLYKNEAFLNPDFINEWKAVKNGLVKAALTKNNHSTLTEVTTHLNKLIDKELKIAQKILSTPTDTI